MNVGWLGSSCRRTWWLVPALGPMTLIIARPVERGLHCVSLMSITPPTMICSSPSNTQSCIALEVSFMPSSEDTHVDTYAAQRRPSNSSYASMILPFLSLQQCQNLSADRILDEHFMAMLNRFKAACSFKADFQQV